MGRRQPNRTTNSKRRTPKIYEIFSVMILLVLICLMVFIFTKGLLSGDNLSAAQAYALQTQKVLNATPTATPFQPGGSQANIYANPDNAPQTTPDPEYTPEILPTSTLKTLTKPKGQMNFLLLGSDIRPYEGGFRTDIIVWVSLNPRDGYVSAVSFPRDLYVSIPGMGENRINVAFPYGGFDLLADTFELNFGVRPDKYILVDFSGFTTVINNLGGVDVQTAQNLTDTCDRSVNSSGMCSAGPGLVHMNGDYALWYARSRYSTNDIDRARRAQEVIEAIFNRLMRLDVILRASDLYDAYTTYVDTNIKLGDVIPLLPLATKINDTRDIRNYVVGYDLAYDWMTWQGAQVLVPDIDGIRELMIKALSLE